MAITPPKQRIWWNEPIEKVELIWIIIAFLWGLFMFGFMIAWHFIGQQNLNKEAYRISPSNYEAKVEEFAKKFKVREEQGVPVVKPPAGTDVYILGRLWQELEPMELSEGTLLRDGQVRMKNGGPGPLTLAPALLLVRQANRRGIAESRSLRGCHFGRGGARPELQGLLPGPQNRQDPLGQKARLAQCGGRNSGQ